MIRKSVALGLLSIAGALHLKSPTLGSINSLTMPGLDGFVEAMAVPTFACTSLDIESSPQLKENLQLPLSQGPAITVRSVLSRALCDSLIEEFESLGFGSFQAGKNHHGALQIVVPEHSCHVLGEAVRPFVDCSQVEARHCEMVSQTAGSEVDANEKFVMVGINRRWRVYRYAAGSNERFSPHIDSAFPPSDHNGKELIWDASRGTVVSRLTLLIYLNDDFVGGETNFFSQNNDQLIASVRPEAGSCLIFPQAVGEDALDYTRLHWPLHEGSPVVSGNRPKYVIRSDILFRSEGNKLADGSE